MPRLLPRFLPAGLFLGMLLPAVAATPPARPNVLFVLSDDHAAHPPSCFGSKLNRTPNLDRIATTGMQTALPWKGLLEDARNYWGELEKDALDAWSAR